jgi:hypothetical protein
MLTSELVQPWQVADYAVTVALPHLRVIGRQQIDALNGEEQPLGLGLLGLGALVEVIAELLVVLAVAAPAFLDLPELHAQCVLVHLREEAFDILDLALELALRVGAGPDHGRVEEPQVHLVQLVSHHGERLLLVAADEHALALRDQMGNEVGNRQALAVAGRPLHHHDAVLVDCVGDAALRTV